MKIGNYIKIDEWIGYVLSTKVINLSDNLTGMNILGGLYTKIEDQLYFNIIDKFKRAEEAILVREYIKYLNENR